MRATTAVTSELHKKSSAASAPLLCRRIVEVLGNVNENDPSLDLLDIAWPELACRALSRQTRGGRMVRIILPPEQSLEHGAVLAQEGRSRLVVNLIPCRALVIRGTADELSKAAYAIGNLHIPAQIGGEEILLPADKSVEAALSQLGLPFQLQTRRIRPMTQSLPRVGLNGDFAVAKRRNER
jgi:urease accessory protein UreE